ncbi:MAG: DUF2971 domain-containing protein [Chloroflexi bacterium]|nr:DUF2971 domain-containing protein [Chloroflexota bacterium]
MREVPKKLFRYRPLEHTSKDLEYMRQTLLDDTLYFSNPNDFNDPFDFKPRIIAGQTQADLNIEKNNMKASLYLDNPSLSDKELEQLSEEWLLHIKHIVDTGQIDLTDEYSKYVRKVGVCCFSECNHNILMWSHYASSHKGYCLEFSTKDPFFQDLARPLEYERFRPVLKMFPKTEGADELRRSITTKATDWEYEREWRVLTQYTGSLSFPPELLKGIIFGCEIDTEHE